MVSAIRFARRFNNLFRRCRHRARLGPPPQAVDQQVDDRRGVQRQDLRDEQAADDGDAERQLGLSSAEAIFEACQARFRPILMTTMAALFAGIPLVIATGPGTELRRPLGITIIGGLFVSQILTLYTTPVIYLLIDRLRRRREPSGVHAPAE